MTTRDDLHRLVDALDEPAVPVALARLRDLLEGQRPAPQWGEAYLLFDGEYASLDDLRRTLDELVPDSIWGTRSDREPPPER